MLMFFNALLVPLNHQCDNSTLLFTGLVGRTFHFRYYITTVPCPEHIIQRIEVPVCAAYIMQTIHAQ